jgi:drug/metabolite transporter (DMT)-like permease
MKTLQKVARLSTGEWCIITAAILWALDGILRRNVYHLPAITIITLEHCIGFIIFFAIYHKEIRHAKLTRDAWTLVGIVSLCSGVLGTLFFTQALLKTQFISFSVVYLLQKLQPLFAIFTGWLVLHERPTNQYLPWAALALCAAYFVTFPGGIVNLETGTGTALAALYAFGAAVLWGGSTAFSRKLILLQGERIATGLRFLGTTIIGSMFLICMGAAGSLSTVTYYDFLILLTIALSTGMFALFVYYRGLRETPVRVATILELSFPLLAVLIDGFMYNTVLAPSQYIAALVLIFAMYMVSTHTRS